jgi:hypothetical protein
VLNNTDMQYIAVSKNLSMIKTEQHATSVVEFESEPTSGRLPTTVILSPTSDHKAPVGKVLFPLKSYVQLLSTLVPNPGLFHGIFILLRTNRLSEPLERSGQQCDRRCRHSNAY